MPTFQFYKNTQKIEEFTGANAGRLEQAINTHQTGDSSTEKDGTFVCFFFFDHSKILQQ